ncbi:MAG TPA: tetraacyldisaccharide 4'-kinase [Gemmatimonadaceae bacterium]|nr:tetraacyldisaccharide 4'-kinase [Gemmatimonadaceae bacterium]
MADVRGVERLWFGDDALAGAARAALAPAEALYAAVVAARGALYDARLLRARASPIAVVSVGNLTVGGTGKTPVAAWLARRLADRGAHPAIVLRGYGADEPLVHQRLNPDVPVIVSPDRVAGVSRAAEETNADVAVLDDAFQHRRAARDADIVLVSADRWTGRRRLLPAGPWRERPRALRRASLAIVTRKAVPPDRAARVADELAALAPDVPRAVVHLAPGELHRADESTRAPLATLAGERVLAISAVGDPGAFAAQLAASGARVIAAPFPDHHHFVAAECARLAARAGAEDARPVCTLKDAVKLHPVWPRAVPPLWYVSQRIDVESGESAIDHLLTSLLDASHRQP